MTLDDIHNKIRNLTAEKKEDLNASLLVASTPWLGYTLGIIYAAASDYCQVSQASVGTLIQPLPYIAGGSLALGSFCYYNRQKMREAYARIMSKRRDDGQIQQSAL